MSKDERSVAIRKSASSSPESVWESMLDLCSSAATYPEVLNVATSPEVDGTRLVEWHILLKGFEIQWKERQIINASNMTIAFVQTEGMFAKYKGHWKIDSSEYGMTQIETQLRIDLGLPHMGEYVNPVLASAFEAFSHGLIDCLVERAFQRDLAAVCG